MRNDANDNAFQLMMSELCSIAVCCRVLGTGLLKQGAVAQASEATGILTELDITHLLSTVAVSLHTVAVGSCPVEDSHVRAFKAKEE